jgi:DNA-binding transcriptional ArsR family regulator
MTPRPSSKSGSPARPTRRAPQGIDLSGATDAVFDALGSQLRRDIVNLLYYDGPEMNSQAIADVFGVSWQAISRHLRILTKAGVLRCDVVGREHVYLINRQTMQEVAGKWIAIMASKTFKPVLGGV